MCFVLLLNGTRKVIRSHVTASALGRPLIQTGESRVSQGAGWQAATDRCVLERSEAPGRGCSGRATPGTFVCKTFALSATLHLIARTPFKANFVAAAA